MSQDRIPTTIADTRKALAAKFPGVVFEFTKGRGRHTDVLVWTGGPSTEDVWSAVAHGVALPRGSWRNPRHWTMHRRMTEAEQEADRVRREAEHEEWLAQAPAREAAERQRRIEAKAEGIRKRAATAGRRKALVAKLAAAFPGVAFDLTLQRGAFGIAWEDGPAAEDVAEAAGVTVWFCTRRESATSRAARVEAERMKAAAAHRADERRRSAKQAARRALFGAGLPLAGPRRVRFARLQPALPMSLPICWAALAGKVA